MKSEKEIITAKTTIYIPTNEPSKCITQKIRNKKLFFSRKKPKNYKEIKK